MVADDGADCGVIACGVVDVVDADDAVVDDDGAAGVDVVDGAVDVGVVVVCGDGECVGDADVVVAVVGAGDADVVGRDVAVCDVVDDVDVVVGDNRGGGVRGVVDVIEFVAVDVGACNVVDGGNVVAVVDVDGAVVDDVVDDDVVA